MNRNKRDLFHCMHTTDTEIIYIFIYIVHMPEIFSQVEILRFMGEVRIEELTLPIQTNTLFTIFQLLFICQLSSKIILQ